MLHNTKKIRVIFLFLLAALMAGCGKEDTVDPVDPEPVEETQTVLALDWDARANGEYTEPEAEEDFGNVSSWKESRLHIEDKTLVVTLLADKLSGSGGIVTNVDLRPATEYRVTYDVMFPEDFVWGRGGKVGFGFRMGDGNTGCNKADGNGGSARMMWYTSDNGQTRFKPYLYYKDMPDNCGDNLVDGAAYPASGSLQKGKWYTIMMRVRSNIGSETNGHIEVTIDGNTVLDHPIRWTTYNPKRLIDRLAFSTFRGGSQDHWKVDEDTYVHFDNLTLERLK